MASALVNPAMTAATSVAAITPPMTATPAAPAAMQEAMLVASTPPNAITGKRAAAVASVNRAMPSVGP